MIALTIIDFHLVLSVRLEGPQKTKASLLKSDLMKMVNCESDSGEAQELMNTRFEVGQIYKKENCVSREFAQVYEIIFLFCKSKTGRPIFFLSRGDTKNVIFCKNSQLKKRFDF